MTHLIVARGHGLWWSAETWVALTTAGLATATFWLANLTRRMSRVASAEVATTIKPLLVDAPRGIFVHEEEQQDFFLSRLQDKAPRRVMVDAARITANVSWGQISVRFAIRNAGSGPALVHDCQLFTAEGLSTETDADRASVRISHTVVPLGEPATIVVSWPEVAGWEDMAQDDRKVITSAQEKALDQISKLTAHCRYSDLNGQQGTVSEFTLRRPDPNWIVSRVGLRDAGGGIIAILGPDAASEG